MLKYIKNGDKTKCCGCRSCEQICPTRCITMEEDNEGYLYPLLDRDNCINCGKCELHCPIYHPHIESEVQTAYGFIHDLKEITDKSSSGGAFHAFSEYILQKNGVVFGCILDEKLKAKHVCAKDFQELEPMHGSKYVQSDTEQTYSQTKEYLEAGRMVLYTGTPCQIAGLRAFLNNDYEHLITVDVVCHGVPSPKLFSKYLGWSKKKYGEDCIGFSFRNKQFNWEDSPLKYITINKEIMIPIEKCPYMYGFRLYFTSRPICYTCQFANKTRTSDITIADFWGVKEFYPKIIIKDGVSSVIANNQKANKILESALNRGTLFKTSLDYISTNNPHLVKPTPKPLQRDSLYKKIDCDFDQLIIEFLTPKFTVKSIVKKLIPARIRKTIKKHIKA